MWTKEALSEAYETFRTKCRESLLERNGFPGPCVVIFGRRHPDTMAPTDIPVYMNWAIDQPYGDRASKEAFSIQTRILASRTDAVAFAFAMEVWFLKLDKDAPPPEGSIEEHPNRQEALLIVFEPGPEAKALGFLPEDSLGLITREGEKVNLAPWAMGTYRDQDFFEGLLPKPKAKA